MILANFHTHTLYCDGKDTPQEIVKASISSGLSSVGFSGHAYTPFDSTYCMSPEDTLKYIAEINSLKEEYSNKIEIYLGTECDLYSEIDKNKYDYIIGSVHYVKSGENYLPVDDSEESMVSCVENFFNGDYMKYVSSYYESVSKLAGIYPDIIGHFDLVTKFNQNNKYFDEGSKKYIELSYFALDALIEKCDLFEINTGAIARGYKTSPYPALSILKRLKEKKARIIFSSDCHDFQNLLFYQKETLSLLKECGFSEVTVLSGGSFCSQPL